MYNEIEAAINNGYLDQADKLVHEQEDKIGSQFKEPHGIDNLEDVLDELLQLARYGLMIEKARNKQNLKCVK